LFWRWRRKDEVSVERECDIKDRLGTAGEDVVGAIMEGSEESPRSTLRGVKVPPSVGSETAVIGFPECIVFGASDCETERLQI